jgi:two-component system sensor histidine kinase TctE
MASQDPIRPSAPAVATLPTMPPAVATEPDNDDEPPLRLFGAVGQARSLFAEILDWMLAPLLLVWPLSVGFTFLVAQSISNAPFDRALSNSVNALAEQVRQTRAGPRINLPQAAREILQSDEADTVYFQVLGGKGELLAGELEMPAPADDDEDRTLGSVRFRDDRVRTNDIRVAFMWLESSEPRQSRPVLIQVGETLEKRTQLANEIIKGVILPQFVVLPISVLLVWFGLTRGIAPLDKLVSKLRARTPQDLSPINPQDAPEEIAPLVTSFNELLARLESTMAAQRRFVADAAHQLKTPLAGLRMQAELALREVQREELDRSLRQIARGSQQASRLASQLLTLAGAENRSLNPDMAAPLDLVQMAREVTGEWVPEALARGHDLGFESCTAPVLILGDDLLLREALKNLIHNALHYTPPPGRITVRVVDLPVPALEVEDTGPGIAESERERVFEPFYRILGNPSDGSGLGLAIVREICQKHGANVQLVVSSDGLHGGLLVRVQFPVWSQNATHAN